MQPWTRGYAAMRRIGVLLLLLLGATAVAGPMFCRSDPTQVQLEARLGPPSPGHPLGRDPLGRDILARAVHGSRISLAVGGTATACSLLIGLIVGALAGYRGGWIDDLVARTIDVFLAFPGLLLAIGLAAALGPSVRNVIIALSLLGWTGYARVVRGEVARLRPREFVLAARALGASPQRILLRHILPMTAPALLVQATFGLSGSILAEASLSFLGLGAPPPLPSWGSMLAEARPFLLVAPRLTLIPGLALTVTILALQIVGDDLRDRLDPRAQR